MPVRALVVTNMYPTATHPGSGTFIADQVESLREAGVEVELLFVDRPHGGRHVYRELGKRARTLVDSLNPDLVHVMYGGVMAAVVTHAIRERPVLVSFCGSDLLGGAGDGVVGSISARYGAFLSRRAAHRASGIIVKSHVLLAALPRGIDKSRVWTVPNGVDFSRFRPLDRAECQARLGWDPTHRHVLFPAPPTRREKRFGLAAAAVDHLNRAGEDVELHALEHVPHADVPVWLNAANAVILTSTHEGSPNAVKEALACNVAVVSVDVGDVRDRIGTIAGCFVADSTPADLAAKLRIAIQREERIDARDHVTELSREHVAETLRGIYRTVTSSPPMSRSARAAIAHERPL